MRILLAEDDPHLLQGLADLLGREGHTCLTADDGEAALDLFRREAPDFCVLDVMLPTMDGFALCAGIRAINAKVPILLLSARDLEIDRVRGFDSGADDYVPKPFGTRELLARIKAIARRSGAAGTPPSTATFRMGDLIIDPGRLSARRESVDIALTPREVQVLSLLHARAGQVVSRDDLFDHCWGRDYLPSSRSLDQYVSALRRKIERDAASPRIIRTVHGAGYRYPGP